MSTLFSGNAAIGEIETESYEELVIRIMYRQILRYRKCFNLYIIQIKIMLVFVPDEYFS